MDYKRSKMTYSFLVISISIMFISGIHCGPQDDGGNQDDGGPQDDGGIQDGGGPQDDGGEPCETQDPEVYNWDSLIRDTAHTQIECPDLRVVYLSQCIIESARGTSTLFVTAGNPTGTKWRTEMEGYAEKIWLVTPSEPQGEYWCQWHSGVDAINGYWHFIGRSPYVGWKDHCDDPLAYLQHIKDSGYATDPNYVSKVSSYFEEAQDLLDNVGSCN